MKQRAKVFIEFPDEPGVNVAWLRHLLEKEKCRVEVQAVLLPIEGMEIPESFRFKGEK